MSKEKADKKENCQPRKVTKAPPPIRPLHSETGITTIWTKNDGETLVLQESPSSSNFWTITGDELIKRWGVEPFIIKQIILDYGLPVRDSITLQIFNVDPDEDGHSKQLLKIYVIEGPFNRFFFRPCDVDTFREHYKDIIEVRKNVTTSKQFISVQVLAQQRERFQILQAVNDGNLTLYDRETGDMIVDIDKLPLKYLTIEEIEVKIRTENARVQGIQNSQLAPSRGTHRDYIRPLTEDEIRTRAKSELESQQGTPIIPDKCKAYRFNDRSTFFNYSQLNIDKITDFLCDLGQAKAFMGIAEADEQPVKSLESGTYVEPVIKDQKEPEKDNPQSVPEYIEKRRKEGVKDEIIAVELSDKKGPYGLTYGKAARALNKEAGVNLSHNGWKMRGSRMVGAGRCMMNQS